MFENLCSIKAEGKQKLNGSIGDMKVDNNFNISLNPEITKIETKLGKVYKKAIETVEGMYAEAMENY